MKHKITYSLLLAAASCGVALGQTTAYTTPVGYETINLPNGVTFNLTSLRLQKQTVAAGTLSGVEASKVTAAIDFTALLTVGKTYILEINDGSVAGLIQEVVQWGTASGNTANDLVTSANLVTLGVQVGARYTLRPAPTLEEIFAGPTVLNGFTSGQADNVWIPNGVGGYTKYFRSALTTPVLNPWKNAGTNANTPNVPVVYQDGILIEKRALSPTSSIIVSGEVKTKATMSPLLAGTLAAPSFNLLGTVFPAGATLQNSGLKAGLLKGFTAGQADNVWIPNGTGSYVKYYVSSLTTPVLNPWKLSSTNANVVVDIPLTPGIIIEHKGAAGNVTFTPPASYSSL